MQSLQALTVERVIRSACIEGEVDTSLVKHPHSFIVVTRVVNSVDANSVDSKLFEHLNVGSEGVSVEEGVLGISGSTRLVCNTADEETLVSGHESIALDSNLDTVLVSARNSPEATSRTGSRLPLWRFFTPAKASDMREAAATADVKVDFMI
jgi:hypothetical protein